MGEGGRIGLWVSVSGGGTQSEIISSMISTGRESSEDWGVNRPSSLSNLTLPTTAILPFLMVNHLEYSTVPSLAKYVKLYMTQVRVVFGLGGSATFPCDPHRPQALSPSLPPHLSKLFLCRSKSLRLLKLVGFFNCRMIVTVHGARRF
jgi:hypothetical protein